MFDLRRKGKHAVLVGLQERGWEPLSLQYSVLITILAGCTTPIPAATCFFSRSPNQVLTRILSTQNITFFWSTGKDLGWLYCRFRRVYVIFEFLCGFSYAWAVVGYIMTVVARSDTALTDNEQ